ncbi:hypothetical protein OK016_26280 [Vibrio chagasii]|nr:hypothetical protein [Vibrio chagasii]
MGLLASGGIIALLSHLQFHFILVGAAGGISIKNLFFRRYCSWSVNGMTLMFVAHDGSQRESQQPLERATKSRKRST